LLVKGGLLVGGQRIADGSGFFRKVGRGVAKGISGGDYSGGFFWSALLSDIRDSLV